MANRPKHAHNRLVLRVLNGRTIKTDLSTQGHQAYLAVRDSLSEEEQAIHFMRLRLRTKEAVELLDKARRRATNWRTGAGVKVSRTELPVSGFLKGVGR